jgi:hypothetical protein
VPRTYSDGRPGKRRLLVGCTDSGRVMTRWCVWSLVLAHTRELLTSD